MKSNNMFCRRSFLKNSLAVSAGITLLGQGIRIFAQDTDEWRWVAFCTQRCDTCSAYTSGGCWSCKSAQGLNGTCSVKRCAIDIKNVPTCAHCDELDTCDTISQDLKIQAQELRNSLNPSAIENYQEEQIEFAVFPNPSSDNLKILNSKNESISFRLIDLQGRILKTGKFESKEYLLNISDIKPGNYILRLMNNKTILLDRKIVKY